VRNVFGPFWAPSENFEEHFLVVHLYRKLGKSFFFWGSLKKFGKRGFLVMHLSRKFEI
jgi:hypothetical protein